MYNHQVPVEVMDIEENKKILLQWGNYSDQTTLEWTFTPVGPDSTFVSIINTGFKGNTDQLIAQIRDSTEGFTLVLAGLKAFLFSKRAALVLHTGCIEQYTFFTKL